MKNIHIIPTDKPSSIGYDGVKNLHFVNDFIDDYQNIYITSDEEIKEGWEGHAYKEDVEGKIFKHFYTTNEWYKDAKKIILTTDQDLIKDGVQAIDDDFLEWFVNNPSCEYIEIENVYDKFLNGDKRSVSDFRKKYKINIPKEEPKQCDICKMSPRLEGTNKCESCYSVVRYFLEQDPRFKDNLLPDLRKEQETLEEAAEKFRSNNPGTMQGGNDTKILNAFKNGAKWQAERMYSEEELQQKIDAHLEVAKDLWLSTIKEQKRMYSEEEVKEILFHRETHYMKTAHHLHINEWFEQFKKK